MQEESQVIRLNKLHLFARKLFISGLIISVVTILLTVVIKAGAYKILKIKTPIFQIIIVIYCVLSLAFLIVSYFVKEVNPKKEKNFYRCVYFYDLYDFFMKCICVLTLIMVYAFSFVIVDGPSMTPTYSDNDILIVRTLGYTPKKNDVSIIYMKDSEMEDYDIKESETKDFEELYIKRIVAVPGDVVKNENNTLYVNDEIVIEKNNIWYRSEETITLGHDEYFVVGDNYGNSQDSRTLGVIKEKNILAKVVFKLF